MKKLSKSINDCNAQGNNRFTMIENDARKVISKKSNLNRLFYYNKKSMVKIFKNESTSKSVKKSGYDSKISKLKLKMLDASLYLKKS